MAVADTRIVRSAGNVLTERGPKILPITVVCKQPGDNGFFDREVYRANVGFAYSGSTLSGLAAHALSSTLLSKLIGAPRTPPPSLSEIAYFVAGASSEYMRDVVNLQVAMGYSSQLYLVGAPNSANVPEASAKLKLLADAEDVDLIGVAAFVENVAAGKFREQIPQPLAKSLWARQNAVAIAGINGMARTVCQAHSIR